MSYLYDLDSKFYDALLAMEKPYLPGTQPGGAGKIPPDTYNRTILIGLGGMGVETVDRIKGVVASRMAPGWENYIAFLAIDSDNNEFDNAPHLTGEELVCITKPSTVAAVSRGEGAYPEAWKSFVDADQARTLVGFYNGVGCRRLVGKMKLHYKNPGSRGVDEEIVEKLARLKNERLAPLGPGGWGGYEVYVIGSVMGGTCSGAFLEMPALIHKALNADNQTRIYAMLYLPDVMIALNPNYSPELKANGYASLKELDYFQGLRMREGTEETFSYNDPACPELRLSSDGDFFTIPYLIGTRNGAARGSKEEAIETVTNFFTGILEYAGEGGFQPASFVHNALGHVNRRWTAEDNDNLELHGTDHSRPKRYGAMGVARAAVPEDVVRANLISQVCRRAGLEPISAPERAARIAKGETLLPFRGEEDRLTPMEVNAANKELLAALNTYMLSYQAPRFTYAAFFGANPTWEEIHDGSADDMARMKLVDNRIEDMTGSEAARRLKEEVNAQFATFRNSVKAYVRQNGPMAFVNLYEGNAERIEGAPRAMGIREILTNLRDNLNPVTKNPRVWPTADDGEHAVKNAKLRILNERVGLFGSLMDSIRGFRAEQADNWVNAFNAWTNIRIHERLRKHMLGTNGVLNKHFIEPAERLCRELYVFGKLLSAMARGYDIYGSVLNDYGDFSRFDGGSAQVNIAALNHNVHAYLKQKTEKAARNVEAEKVRYALVDSFFNDPAKWVEYDEDFIERWRGGTSICLVNPNKPVSARFEFDRCLRQTMPATVEIKVEELFDSSSVDANEFASQIVTKLSAKSTPLFNGDLPGEDHYCYMIYPRSLKPELKTALENAARTMVDPQMNFYCTKYADAIMMYQMVAPFELYKLAELPEWEKAYLQDMKFLGIVLHGRSPDVVRRLDANGAVTYEEVTSWFDYPAITYSRDHKAADPVTKEISHEGRIRIEMDKLIKEARKKGILYSHKTNNNNTWIIRYVRLGCSRNWQFDDALLKLDRETGLLPEGRELLEQILAQNRTTLRDCSRVVRLAYAGLLSREHSSEAYAWEYASRVLYAHRPMFIEIREALEKVRPWFDAAEAINTEIKKAWNPAKMYKLIQGGILTQSKNGLWTFRDDRGAQVAVANMNPAKLEVLRDSKPKEIAIVDAGLNLYYLFDKLMKKISNEELDEALERANERLSDDGFIASDELLAVNAMVRTMLSGELERISAMLADPESGCESREAFARNLAQRGITKEELPDEILDFYKRIRWWEEL